MNMNNKKILENIVLEIMVWNRNNFSGFSLLEPTVSWQELANATAER